MIAIRKGAAPEALICDGERHATELCAAYDAEPALYGSAKPGMEIRKSIYGSKAVKAELDKCHHGKCCYCETRIEGPYAHSYVEHWRPESSSRQGLGQERNWPGYYWLAYHWDNLLWSCFFCNSSNKSDLFPLENPTARARNHHMRIEDERPFILKPDGDINIRDHITFHLEVPVGITDLGRKTIEVLGLDSPKHGLRLDHLNEIRKSWREYIDLRGIDHPVARDYAERARRFVEDAVRPEKKYSAMAAAYLEANPWPELGTDAVMGAA